MDDALKKDETQPPLVPEHFLFGVATAGFQVEGGFNGPGEPSNNWASWERSARVEPSGSAIGFWDSYEDHLDRVASLGCNSFRMSLEWARVEPEEGTIDEAALDRYGAILRACEERGIEPLVTLHHFTHPEWAGEDLWLRPDSPEMFARWVELAVGRLGEWCSKWVTINELNILAIESYLIGTFPPGRFGDLPRAERALDNLLTAHIRAYGTIHGLQPDALVSTNNYALSAYELDRLLADLLSARGLGVPEGELSEWLASRREEFYSRIPDPGEGRATRVVEQTLRRLAARASERRGPLGAAFPRASTALYAAEMDRTFDVVQLDYYDPFVSHHLRMPGHKTAGGRNWLPGRMLWDDLPCPSALGPFVEAARQEGMEIWLVENGMGSRVRLGRTYPRLDRYDRPRYMREHLAEVASMVARGIPITGYWHWTLADNYEWGSYEPRFGIFGIDRERGTKWLGTDSLGQDAPGEYRRLIEGLRSGDASVLAT